MNIYNIGWLISWPFAQAGYFFNKKISEVQFYSKPDYISNTPLIRNKTGMLQPLSFKKYVKMIFLVGISKIQAQFHFYFGRTGI